MEKVAEVSDGGPEEAGDGGEGRGAAAVTGAVAEAPDGGWGWMVLLATIIVLALTLAFPSCVGIFYTDLQKEFHASNSQTSWVPSIMTSVLHAGGKALRLGSVEGSGKPNPSGRVCPSHDTPSCLYSFIPC